MLTTYSQTHDLKTDLLFRCSVLDVACSCFVLNDTLKGFEFICNENGVIFSEMKTRLALPPMEFPVTWYCPAVFYGRH